MTLTPADLARILALAEKATIGEREVSGPYKYENDTHASYRIDLQTQLLASVWSSDGDGFDNARFMAALDPATVIALVRMAQGGEG